MMFEPRSRGFSDPLLGQPFYGWYCAPLAPGFFSALGRLRRPSGVWGGATTCRPRRHASTPFDKLGGERIGGSPHFSLLHDFCHGLLDSDAAVPRPGRLRGRIHKRTVADQVHACLVKEIQVRRRGRNVARAVWICESRRARSLIDGHGHDIRLDPADGKRQGNSFA